MNNTVSNTVASIKGIPTKADLKGLLEQNVVVVDFNKISGDKRVMTCTLREDMKPAATKDRSNEPKESSRSVRCSCKCLGRKC